MKPDKIYISPMPNPADGYVGVAWADAHRDMVEYIRKDALLDWLKQSKQEMEEDLKGTDGLKMAMIATAISSFQEVIEKIESL